MDHRQPARLTLLSAAFTLLALALCAVGPARAEIFYWKDAKGVVHMTDRKTGEAAQKGEVLGGTEGTDGPARVDRKQAVARMLAVAKEDPLYAQLQRLVAEYHASHSYSTADYFTCVDMALELSNIVKTKGFNPKLVAGNIKMDTAGMPPGKLREVFDHAWVVVELHKGVQVALEATGGYVADERAPNFDYYYQGLVFDSPRQAKETDALIHNAHEYCKEASALISEWNAKYVGRPPSPGSFEVKGRVDAKVAECNESSGKYEELLKRQYRALY